MHSRRHLSVGCGVQENWEGTLQSVAELGASCAARRIGRGVATCVAS